MRLVKGPTGKPPKISGEKIPAVEIDQHAMWAIDRIASWVTDEVEGLMKTPFIGDFIRNKLVRFMGNFKEHLRESGIDESKIGYIAQEVYARLLRILNLPEK